MTENQHELSGLEIAIVGMAGRFPGARDVDAFWHQLSMGVEGISSFTHEELAAAGVDPELARDPSYVAAAGVLEDIDSFDASLFGFQPREAEITDPQQRFFLECAWEALERAGYNPKTYRGSIGVYAGVARSTYAFHVYSRPEILETLGQFRVELGIEKDYLSSRVSYKLGLTGPSMVVQTACSTSLVCVHLACQALLAGECHMALAGGVSVALLSKKGYLYQQGGVHSPDGHCRPFDARAGGTVAGDGVGIVVLKRLEDALQDGDHIHALIKGTAVNNDGDVKIGYTAPSSEGQAAVIRAALEVAEVDPATVGYVEAHGTATPLGDPIEIAGLARAFDQTLTDRAEDCVIGSVKGNIGHLDAAAGVAGLIKTALALEHGKIPPTLHFESANPEIDLAGSPFQVNTRCTLWPAMATPRRAGVSSFGIGGTNAHAVLEQAPPSEASGPSREWQLLTLSAATTSALEAATKRLAEHLEADDKLADVAFTLKVGRRRLEHRRVLVCGDQKDAVRQLREPDSPRVLTRRQRKMDRPLAFLFPGQGVQYPGMGRGLYDSEPVYRHWIDACADGFASHMDLDLHQLLYPREESASGAEDQHRNTAIAQPTLFATELAMARLLLAWGIEPELMIGHSLGEFVAACLAETLSLDDALRLVATRGRLMQALPQGAMLAVAASEDQLAPELDETLALAAVNGPGSLVLSGTRDAVQKLASRLAAKQIETRLLHTSHAFHSPMVDAVLLPFAAELQRVELKPPCRPWLSNLTGKPIRDAEATDPDYWVRHLRQTVRFDDGLRELWRAPGRILLEVGPGGTLGALARRSPDRQTQGVVLATLQGAKAQNRVPDQAFMLETLGRLWMVGVDVDWPAFYAGERRQRVVAPTYPFERRRFWLDLGAHFGGTDTAIPATTPAQLSSTETAAEERASLPAMEPNRPDLETPWVAPRNVDEERLAEIWQALMGIQPIGIHDDFFELGGDSLLAAQLLARLRDTFGVEPPLERIFEQPTVAGLAEVIALWGAETSKEDAAVWPVLVPDPAHRHEPFPLTDIQQAYWIGRSAALELGNVATHVYDEIEFENLDPERLETALGRLIERHAMLRAVVLPDGRQQILAEVPPYRIEVLDLTGQAEELCQAELMAIRDRMSHQVLSCEQWPLFELRITRLDARRVRLHLSFDLLLGDALSFLVLSDDLVRFYAEPEFELTALEISFRDYVLAAREIETTEAYGRALSWWRDRLATFPPAPDLPLARRLSELDQPRFVRRTAVLSEALWSRLKAQASKRRVTPSGILLSIFAEVLALWSKTPRFALNLTLFNRLPLHPQVGALVGDFTSLLLLVVDASGDRSFADRARRLQQQLWQALDHRAVSGVRVIRELAAAQGLAGQVAMPVVFTSTLGLDAGRVESEEPAPEIEELGISGEEVFSISQTPQVLFDHQVSENRDGELVFNWDVVEEAYPEGLLNAMFETYGKLLHGLAEEKLSWDEPVHGLLSDDQLAARRGANATDAPVPSMTLGSLVRERAICQADRPAVIAGERTLSYAELGLRTHLLAAELRCRGVQRNRLVAVVLEKGWRQVVAVLAVVEAGAAYLPIDPNLPPERLCQLLEKGEVALALTSSRWDTDLEWPAGVGRVVVLAEAAGEAVKLDPVASPEDLAYVIFTSGSTGQPKGVMIDHQGAVNTVLDVNQRFAVGPGDRVLALSALSFDLSVYDIFGVLAAGGTVVIPEPEAVRDPQRWLQLLTQHRVTIWNTVPTLLEMLVEHTAGRGESLPAELRLAMLSGDWIPVGLPERFHALAPEAEMVSLGGATEASIWSILHRIDRVEPEWRSIPYGRAMVNQSFHVLDERLEPRPVWVPGELYIGGLGLAQGYWRAPEKTQAAFFQHPRTGERLYRTGDWGRFLPDGQIEFLGREDFQVKVQGFRVELGEIEWTLRREAGVEEVAVIAPGGAGHRRLVACLAPGDELSVEALEGVLRRRLPPYMVPAEWLLLDALPLSANGKVDRSDLARRAEAERAGRIRPEESATAAGTPVEEVLAGLWSELLDRRPVAAAEDFFAAGGDSLRATQLAVRIRESFGVEIPLQQIFELPTLGAQAEALCAALVASSGAVSPPIGQAPADEPLPLSFSQERLWFFEQLNPGTSAFNIARVLPLKRIDVAALVASFEAIERRHEVLRTRFVVAADGVPGAEVLAPRRLHLPVVDLMGLGRGDRQHLIAGLAGAEADRPFDLRRGRLWRYRLLALNEGEHVLLLTVHHLVCDGWSLEILVQELTELYAAATTQRRPRLPELRLQYGDFAWWQRRQLEAVLESQLGYWRQQLAGIPELLEIPTDRPRSMAGAGLGGALPVVIPSACVAALRELSRQQSATLFMALLAAFQTLLHLLTGEEDIVIGTSVASRTRAELEPLVGCFVNLLPLRGELSGNPTFAELLQRVRSTTLGAFAHQDVPFEKLVDDLAPRRRTEANPIFQVVFEFHRHELHGDLGQAEVADSEAAESAMRTPLPSRATFDLMLFLEETAEELRGHFHYNADLFDLPTVDGMKRAFKDLLAEVLADPSRPLASLNELARAESKPVLDAFNEPL